MHRRSNHHWFKSLLVAWSAPSHYLNQCWRIVNWNPRNKFKWNRKRNAFHSRKCRLENDGHFFQLQRLTPHVHELHGTKLGSDKLVTEHNPDMAIPFGVMCSPGAFLILSPTMLMGLCSIISAHHCPGYICRIYKHNSDFVLWIIPSSDYIYIYIYIYDALCVWRYVSVSHWMKYETAAIAISRYLFVL